MSPLRLLLLLIWLVQGVSAATLTGLRWFDHEDYVRVVFDVSTQVAFRVSERPDKGYVDLIMEGELAQGMRPRIEINSGPVLYAEQKLKTSTSLTWRIHTENTTGARGFGLGEKPYKIVIDVYKAGHTPSKTPPDPAQAEQALGGAGKSTPRKTSPAVKEELKPVAQPATEPTPRAGTASAQGKNEGAAGKPARPTTGPETAQRTPTTAPAEARIDREQAVMHPGAAATEAPLEGDGIEAWVDLKGPARLQAQVGALLLELGQAPEALEHLQAADSLRGGHPGVGLLLGTAWYRLGDEYRCRLFLSSALEDERYRARAEEVLGRLSPPDAQGQVPGGEIATEDLEYFLGVLRRGSRLDYQDLSAPVVVTQTTSTGFGLGLTLGLALAGLGGLVGYVVSKRGEEEKRRKQILGASARAPIAPQKPLADVEGPREETQRPATARRPVDAPAPPEPRVRPAPAPVSMDDPEDNAVYQQVQAELERHLEKAAAAPLTPESLAGFDEPAAHEPFVVAPPAPAPAPQPVETDLLDEPDLNEQVYQMADANRPIVEIAEALELGEDEVKLILDLRPQLPED